MIILDQTKTEPGYVKGQVSKSWRKKQKVTCTTMEEFRARQSSAEDVINTGSFMQRAIFLLLLLSQRFVLLLTLDDLYFFETTTTGGRGEKSLHIRMQAAIRRKRDYWNTTTIRKGDYGRHCMCVLWTAWGRRGEWWRQQWHRLVLTLFYFPTG